MGARLGLDRFAVKQLAMAAVLAGSLLALPGVAFASTFTVTNDNDSGTGSLREAIINSNAATPGPNTIDFSLSNATNTISLASPLSATTTPVTIDGPSTVSVNISGSGISGSPDGFTFGSGSGIAGGGNVSITGFTGDGLDATGDNAISGVIAEGNQVGIELAGSGSTVSNSTISGNETGIVVDKAATSGTIEGNVIGTSAAGGTTPGTSTYGIWGLGSGITVSGDVISGNSAWGLYIVPPSDGGSATGSWSLTGNEIGTNAAGNAANPNGSAGGGGGIYLGQQDNMVGGTSFMQANVIAGNDGPGVQATGSAATGNSISANYIGTGPDSTPLIPNTAPLGTADGATASFYGNFIASSPPAINFGGSPDGAYGNTVLLPSTGGTIYENSPATGQFTVTGTMTSGGNTTVTSNFNDGLASSDYVAQAYQAMPSAGGLLFTAVGDPGTFQTNSSGTATVSSTFPTPSTSGTFLMTGAGGSPMAALNFAFTPPSSGGGGSGGGTTPCGPSVLSGTPPPDGAVGQAYSATITASGGSGPPYTFALSSGSLPPGLTLQSDGTITGTPTTPGDFSFVVVATGANGCPGTRSYSIDVPQLAAPGPCHCLAITAYLSNFHTFGPDSTRVEFRLNWRLTCTAGSGDCEGRIKIDPPSGADFIREDGKPLARNKKGEYPATVTVKCPGPCTSSSIGHTTLTYVALSKNNRGQVVGRPGFLMPGRQHYTFEIAVETSCVVADGRERHEKSYTFKLRFNSLGQVDYQRSKLGA